MEDFLINHGHLPVLTNSIYDQLEGQPDVNKRPTMPTLSTRWKPILDRVEKGERIGAEDATILMDEAPFQELGRVAAKKRQVQVPGNIATYVFDKNLNTTNVCVVDCKFCAFYTNPENKRGYTRTPEQILEEAKKAADAGATQILIQGGLNPDLKLDYYEKCLSLIRDNVDIWIHSLSPTEIEYIAAEENITIKECLIRLQAAGLQSLPGGGAEMLVDDIRKRSVQKNTFTSMVRLAR